MLVGMASEITKNYPYKCVDRTKHNGIKGAMTNVHTNQILARTLVMAPPFLENHYRGPYRQLHCEWSDS